MIRKYFVICLIFIAQPGLALAALKIAPISNLNLINSNVNIKINTSSGETMQDPYLGNTRYQVEAPETGSEDKLTSIRVISPAMPQPTIIKVYPDQSESSGIKLENEAEIKGINPQPEPPKENRDLYDAATRQIETVQKTIDDTNLSGKTLLGEKELDYNRLGEIEMEIDLQTGKIINAEELKGVVLPPQKFNLDDLSVWAQNFAEVKDQSATNTTTEKIIETLRNQLSQSVINLGDDNSLRIMEHVLILPNGREIDWEKIKFSGDHQTFPPLLLNLSATSTESEIKYPVELTLNNKDSVLKFLESENNADQIENGEIKIKANFRLDRGQLILTEGDKDYNLKVPVNSLYYSAKQVAARAKGELEETTLGLVNDQAVYQFKVREKVRFLGVIPIKVSAQIKFDASADKYLETSRPWWTALATKHDYLSDFKTLPNIKAVKAEIKPLSYNQGDKISLLVYYINDSIKSVFGGCDPDENGVYHCPRAILKVNGNEIDSIDHVYIIKSGEEQKVYFEVSQVDCGASYEVVLDPDNQVEELTKADNVYQLKIECALQNAPDLIGVNLTYDNYNTKIIGQNNKADVTIKNVGNQPTPDSGSLAVISVGPDKFLRMLNVPTLNPGQSAVVKFEYTPDDCTPLQLKVDSGKQIAEKNEDNNIFIEPDWINTNCHRRPDLEFQHVYWMAGGYSFGRPQSEEYMPFDLTIRNNSNFAIGACAPNTILRVWQGSIKLFDQSLGAIGCPVGSVYDSYGPGHYLTHAKFNIQAKCGEIIVFQLDPGNQEWERQENNNFWIKTIECQ
jgi:hypothetical protein